MKNYLIVNEFLNSKPFANIYSELKNAFNQMGEELEILTNVSGQKLLNENGNGAPILFFDKDVFFANLLEKQGYKCVNSSFAIKTCDDKAKTYLKLKGKVNMPKSIIAPFSYSTVNYTNYNFISEIEKQLSYPFIVKQNKGSFGQQVYLVNNNGELKALLQKISSCEILFQEFIKSSAGKDIRVYVVGEKIVASALRHNPTDFRSNVNAGGSMQKIELSEEYAKIALSAVKELGADFAGVDLLIGENGPLVCEVNSNAHFTKLSEVTGVNVAQEIVKYYLSLK